MPKQHKENLIFLISMISAVLSYVLLCKLVGRIHPFNVDVSLYAQCFISSNFLKPEPFEMFCFVFGLFYLPVSFIMCYFFLDRLDSKNNILRMFYSNDSFNKMQNIVLMAALFLWGYYMLKGAKLGIECWTFNINLNYYWLKIVLVLFVSLLLFSRIYNRVNSPIIFIIGLFIILATSLTQIHTNKIMVDNGFINAHFGMIAGAINQVFHGKTILVEISSLYGILYPYFGALFTKILGLNILNISIYFVSLIFLSFLFIYLALSEKIGYGSWVSLVSLIAVTGIAHPFFISTTLFGGVNNTYYQYHPIRVIFGSFFLWFSFKYLKNSSRSKYIFGLLLCGIGSLWNFDTGIPLVISWLGFLIYNTLSMKQLNLKEKLVKSFYHLLFVGLTLLLTVLAYDIFAYLRTRQLPSWSEMLELQKIFTDLGFYLAPMKIFDLWNIVILIYMGILFSCLIALFKNRVTDSHRYYFFIALFGMGIFAYYQGRSFVSNLLALTYPAVMLMAFLLDDISKKYHIDRNNFKYLFKDNLFRFDFIKLFFLSIVFTYGIAVFFAKLPDLYKWVSYNISAIREGSKTNDIYVNFIIENKKNDQTIIFSNFSDYYYCLTGTFSGLPYSSAIEAVASWQWETIKDVIKSKKIKQIFYGIGGVPEKFNQIIYPEILKNYIEVKENADGGLILYEAK